MPQIKGQMKPMVNAANVGSRNTGQYFLIAFSMRYLREGWFRQSVKRTKGIIPFADCLSSLMKEKRAGECPPS